MRIIVYLFSLSLIVKDICRSIANYWNLKSFEWLKKILTSMCHTQFIAEQYIKYSLSWSLFWCLFKFLSFRRIQFDIGRGFFLIEYNENSNTEIGCFFIYSKIYFLLWKVFINWYLNNYESERILICIKNR